MGNIVNKTKKKRGWRKKIGKRLQEMMKLKKQAEKRGSPIPADDNPTEPNVADKKPIKIRPRKTEPQEPAPDDTCAQNSGLPKRSTRLELKQVDEQEKILRSIEDKKAKEVEEIMLEENEQVEQKIEIALEMKKEKEQDYADEVPIFNANVVRDNQIKDFEVDPIKTEEQETESSEENSKDKLVIVEKAPNNERKRSIEADAYNPYEFESDDLLMAKEVKRKRSRPRKVHNNVVTAVKHSLDTENQEIESNEGNLVIVEETTNRHRKGSIEDDAYNPYEFESDDLLLVKEVKRKRGRPRKVDNNVVTTVKHSRDSINTENQETESNDGNLVIVEESTNSHRKGSVEDDAYNPYEFETDDLLVVKERKHQRGRPRKIVENAVTVVKEKRSRGRPKLPRDAYGRIIRETPVYGNFEGREQNEGDEDSEGEYTVYIAEDTMEDPIPVQGIINYTF